MARIKIASIPRQKGLHDPAQGNFSDLQQKVKMIPHQRIGIKAEGVSFLGLGQIAEEPFQISVIEKDSLPPISSGDDVI